MRVEAERLSRRFGDVTALDDVTFTLPPGRRVALVGPNGSGKSTLNRVLVGLLVYDGVVKLDGCSPRDRSAGLASQLAYLPQTSPQLAAPVRELVRAICALREISASEVATRAAEFDLDLDAIASRPLRGLSGGMRQKLLLSLALARPVSLLILDEPTASLDPEARRCFVEQLQRVPTTTTIVLCSHRLEEIGGLVDHVLALEDGRIVHDGSAAAFAAREAALETGGRSGGSLAKLERRSA